MGNGRLTGWIARLGLLTATVAFAGVVVGACNAQSGGPDDALGTARSAVFTNGGFETGAAGTVPAAPWALTDFVNLNGVTIQNPQTYAGLNLFPLGPACANTAQCTGVNPQLGTTCTAGRCAPASKTIILNSATGPGTQPDPTLGATASLRWPRYGNQCAIVNQLGDHINANQLVQTMTVGAGDVDPTDNKVHVRFVVAPVLEDPGHAPNQQPYFFVQLTNLTQSNAVLYTNYNFSNQPGVPWQGFPVVNPTYRYTNWQLVDIAPGSPAINMGDQVQLVLVAAGCSLGAHMGELYVDGLGATIPGLFVSGTGPAQVNPCVAPAADPITYTLTYKNGSAAAETGVVITFNTPPNTTFQSLTPPAGAVCVNPGVGNAGAVVCTFSGAVPAGSTGSMTITVNLVCGSTGVVTAGDYQIGSTQETPLLGSKITTDIGCTQDSQCPIGDWCNETANVCTPTLPNGSPIPSDLPHTNPSLNGTCTAGAGALVCTSGVCDPADNACGFANGDGSCTSGNSDVVCRSGACDLNDGKCGYANSDGPCTGGAVCRSGACDTNDDLCGYAVGDGPCTAGNPGVCRTNACSVSGNCEPSGGCDLDADCTGGKWCNETAHVCTSPLANGQPIPNDPPHSSPTLSAMCTQAAAMLVCASGVCDTDNLCGYADGDGPCTDSSTCRSAMCSTNGLCEPPGGCNVDSDCATTQYCDTPTNMC